MPFHGVIPWLLDVWLDSEDTLEVGHWRASTAWSASSRDRLKVAVIRLPRISNATDVDALAAEPGVDVLVTIDPAVAESADLLVLPGSRSTASDLAWLRERGLAEVVARRVRGRSPGPRHLRRLPDARRTRSRTTSRERVRRRAGPGPPAGAGRVPREKVLARPVGSWSGHPVDSAYEIHHGIARRVAPALATTRIRLRREPFLDGWNVGSVWGTMWHGAFESDDFRRAWLAEVARAAGSRWRPEPGAPGFAERRERMLDTLADALEEHVDIDALLSLTRVPEEVGRDDRADPRHRGRVPVAPGR